MTTRNNLPDDAGDVGLEDFQDDPEGAEERAAQEEAARNAVDFPTQVAADPDFDPTGGDDDDDDDDRPRRQVGPSGEPTTVIDREGESIPLEDLPPIEPRRERLEDERLDEEQLSERISRRRRLGLDESDLLEDEPVFTQRLDEEGNVIESFEETRAGRESRLGQEAALADQFGGGTQGEIEARRERARFEAARQEWRASAFQRALEFADVMDNAGIPESEQLPQMEAFLERDFDNFVGSRTQVLTGDLPRDEVRSFASRVLAQDRQRDQFEAMPRVQGGDGSFLSQSDFNNLTPEQQQVFTSQGFEALRTFTNQRNIELVTGGQPTGLFLPPTPAGFGAGGPITQDTSDVPSTPGVGPGVVATPEAVIEQDIERSNTEARSLLNDREYFEYLTITGQSQEAIDFSLRQGVTVSDAEIQALQAQAQSQQLGLDPRFGVFDPRVAVPQSAVASQFIANTSAAIVNAVRTNAARTGRTASQVFQELRGLEIRPSTTLGSGPTLPVVIRRGQNLSPELRADIEQALDESFARRVIPELPESGSVPPSVDPSLVTQPQITGRVAATPEMIARAEAELAEAAARFRARQQITLVPERTQTRIVDPSDLRSENAQRFRLELQRDLGRMPSDSEVVRAITQHNFDVRTAAQVSLRNKNGVIVDTATGQAVSADTLTLLRSVGVRAQDLAPATVATSQSSDAAIPATTVFEGEQAGPAIITRPEPAAPEQPVTTTTPRIVTQPAPEIQLGEATQPQIVTQTQPLTNPETGTGTQPQTVTQTQPLTLPQTLAQPQVSPETGPLAEVNPLTETEREQQTRTEDELLADEPPPPPRDTPEAIRPRDLEAPRRPVEDVPTRGPQPRTRGDLDLDAEDEVEGFVSEQFPRTQGFRVDLQNDEVSPEDDLYVVNNRETGQTTFSTDPVANIPTTGADENESLRTITTDDEQHPERVIQVGGRTYALNDQTVEQINELESEIGRPLTAQEREVMALSERDSDAFEAISERADRREDNAELDSIDESDDRGSSFNLGPVTIQARGATVNLRSTEDLEIERQREADFPVIDKFNRRMKTRARGLDPNRRLNRRFR